MASETFTFVKTAEINSPYSVLGVSVNSSREEIKRAYQRLILKVRKLFYLDGLSVPDIQSKLATASTPGSTFCSLI